MVCNSCEINDATYHSSSNIDGNIVQEHLCNNCAKSKKEGQNKPVSNIILDNKTNSLINIGKLFEASQFNLDDIIDENKNNNQAEIDKPKELCGKCKQSYSQFVDIGLLGCDNCYIAFQAKLQPLISNFQTGSSHVGKQLISEESDEVMTEIKELEFKLKQAVAAEDYELASAFKKQIAELKTIY